VQAAAVGACTAAPCCSAGWNPYSARRRRRPASVTGPAWPILVDIAYMGLTAPGTAPLDMRMDQVGDAPATCIWNQGSAPEVYICTTCSQLQANSAERLVNSMGAGLCWDPTMMPWTRNGHKQSTR
jgi:hypothetical protein